MVKLTNLLKTIEFVFLNEFMPTVGQFEGIMKFFEENSNISAQDAQIVDSGSYSYWGYAQKRKDLNPMRIGYTNSRKGQIRMKTIWICKKQ